jgi:hypothetical protein
LGKKVDLGTLKFYYVPLIVLTRFRIALSF